MKKAALGRQPKIVSLPYTYEIKAYPDSSFKVIIQDAMNKQFIVEGRVYSTIGVAWKASSLPAPIIYPASSSKQTLSGIMMLHEDEWKQAVLDSLRRHRFAK